MIPSAPKFRKIVLLLKDEDNKPTTRMEYMDSAMMKRNQLQLTIPPQLVVIYMK